MVSMVEPKVIKLAETRVDKSAAKLVMKEYGPIANEWLQGHLGSWKSDSEMLIEIAGRVCYKSFGKGLNPNISKVRTLSKDYFENVLRKGDGSILEHATITFALMWVSRVFTHQLVRHRAGTAFSQESLRYVRTKEIRFPNYDSWVPAEVSQRTKRQILGALKHVELSYRAIQARIPWQDLSFDGKKRVTSAIRRILPQGVATVIIFTANHRALRWLIEMRTDQSAEIEIRKVFGRIAEVCIVDYPLIYSDFRKVPSPDGIPQYKPTLRSKV
jgi:thymidylate synthase (FAD)